MEFEGPSENQFTVYSKSGCHNCIKVKEILNEYSNTYSYNTVDCDEYLVEDNKKFIEFMKTYSGKELKTFPIVFFNKKYVGGYNETVDYIEQLLAFEEKDF
jgi:glutaredoxin